MSFYQDVEIKHNVIDYEFKLCVLQKKNDWETQIEVVYQFCFPFKTAESL